jgi:superfamily II DNA or RNA helicase
VGKRESNCIFAVDLFNEGLDLPQVNTVLLLRLTQSATIFLQLGRGLRRAEG